MSSTAISYRPTFKFSPRLPSQKPISPHKLSISESRFSSKHNFRLTAKIRIWGQTETRMTELTKTPFPTSTDDLEGFGIMEQEAILSNGSSGFRSDFMSGGLESTINKMSKWLVAVLFGIAILWKHDAEALWAGMGCVMNAGLSVTLKQIFNQERPFSTLRSDPGMPSSHAQSIFFAVVFAILSMVKFLGLNKITVALGVLALASGSYLSWLRVSQRLHTISQVSVGAVIGTIFSILWFQAWYAFVLKAFIASLWVRIVVVLGSAMVCASFFVYAIQHWLMEES